jgi:hypothetical protein
MPVRSTKFRPNNTWHLEYLFTKHLTTKIKNVFPLYIQLNKSMLQVGMKVLLHPGVIRFDHFGIYGWRIINALQCLKNLILVVRFFVNRYSGPLSRGGLGDLHCASHAVTQCFSFSSLIRRTAPFSYLLWHARDAEDLFMPESSWVCSGEDLLKKFLV